MRSSNLFVNIDYVVFRMIRLIGSANTSCQGKTWDLKLLTGWGTEGGMKFKYNNIHIDNVSYGVGLPQDTFGAPIAIIELENIPGRPGFLDMPNCDIQFSHEDYIVDSQVQNCKITDEARRGQDYRITCTNNVYKQDYHFYEQENYSWRKANAFCQANHQGLASVDSPQGLAAIKSL